MASKATRRTRNPLRRFVPRAARQPRSSRTQKSRDTKARRLLLERLEPRRLLATFLVTNTDDVGVGSLRQAISDANAAAGADTIPFSIGNGLQTIAPESALPTITERVTIDGTTQPGYADRPLIELNGAGAGQAAGLTLGGGDSTVRGLVINRFWRYGIEVISSGNTIEGNYIGGWTRRALRHWRTVSTASLSTARPTT